MSFSSTYIPSSGSLGLSAPRVAIAKAPSSPINTSGVPENQSHNTPVLLAITVDIPEAFRAKPLWIGLLEFKNGRSKRRATSSFADRTKRRGWFHPADPSGRWNGMREFGGGTANVYPTEWLVQGDWDTQGRVQHIVGIDPWEFYRDPTNGRGKTFPVMHHSEYEGGSGSQWGGRKPRRGVTDITTALRFILFTVDESAPKQFIKSDMSSEEIVIRPNSAYFDTGYGGVEDPGHYFTNWKVECRS